jgi:hypothetical protein
MRSSRVVPLPAPGRAPLQEGRTGSAGAAVRTRQRALKGAVFA